MIDFGMKLLILESVKCRSRVRCFDDIRSCPATGRVPTRLAKTRLMSSQSSSGSERVEPGPRSLAAHSSESNFTGPSLSSFILLASERVMRPSSLVSAACTLNLAFLASDREMWPSWLKSGLDGVPLGMSKVAFGGSRRFAKWRVQHFRKIFCECNPLRVNEENDGLTRV